MKIHYLLHVPFETPAAINKWADERGYGQSYTRLYEQVSFPDTDQYDLLVVMGGPMGVHDEQEYSWLAPEKEFISQAINGGKPVIGICLGAQLLAHSLGARVMKNRFKEIGFFQVALTPIGWNSPIFKALPGVFDAFHWHGDTFQIPEKGYHIASSEACPNQAFVYDDRVVGLQFHIESTRDSIEALVKNCGDELREEDHYIQKPDVILDENRDFDQMHSVLYTFLDSFVDFQKEKGRI
ncbi:MAG: amidotransferase [Thermodesulfatator sp.]|nr:MAG: amidotransferase [Thermodesulfatator sp.]